MSQATMEPEKKAGTSEKEETQEETQDTLVAVETQEDPQHTLVTALESKIEQLNSVMKNEDLEGTIHQVVDKLRKDSEAESEAERKHTDLHIAVDDLKTKLEEKSKQVKSYELALKATAQQLEELTLMSETRLKNAAEHGSRGPMSATVDGGKCIGCGLPDEGFQLRNMEFQDLEHVQHQLAMTNNALVQGLSERDKRIAELEETVKHFENKASVEQVTDLSIPPEEGKCKTCGLEFKALDDARSQLAVTNDILMEGLNGRDKRIMELEGTIKQFESEVQEARACLQETNMLIAGRDNRIEILEMELLRSAAAAASTPAPSPPPQQNGTPLCAGQQGSSPPSHGGKDQKPPNSACPVQRSTQSPPTMTATMQHVYDAFQNADKSLEGAGSGTYPVQGAMACMSAHARAQEEAAKSVHGTQNQEPVPNHTEFHTHADPATFHRVQHKDTCSVQEVLIPYSTVVELSRQQTTGWISDFPQPFHSSSIHAIATSKSTSGASSPSQELQPLADVAGTYDPHPANRLH